MEKTSRVGSFGINLLEWVVLDFLLILWVVLGVIPNLKQIFIKLQRHFKSSINTDNSRAAEEIDKAISYFSEHYNEPISIDDYAEQNHVSASWFIRNFRLYAGITPKQFILQKRIYNAEALLQNTQYNINEIAQIVGYDNPLYFSRIFQKAKGLSPSEYRKNI